MKKRFLSIVLALAMVITLLPLNALAINGETGSEETPSTETTEGLLRSHIRNVTHPTHLSEGSASITDMICTDPSPGLLSFEKGEVKTTGQVKVKSWSVGNDAVVRYTLTGGKEGDTITLPITVHSEVYGKDTLEVVITLGYRKLTITSATTVIYGSTLKLTCAGLNGTGSVVYSIVSGAEFATINGDVLVPLKVGSVTIKATQVTDGKEPAQHSESVTITIEKATPTGAPRYTALTRAGLTLGDVILTNGTFTLEGTLEWVLSDATPVVANVAYEWIFTPADSHNYNCVTGMIIPYVVTDNAFAIGNGTTVLNSDGSYTTTAYGEDDSRYELTEYPDGRMRMVHRQLDGTIVTTVLEVDGTRTQTVENKDSSSQITARLPDGTVHSTTKDKYGKVSVQIFLPYYLTSNAAKNDKVVELPIPEIPNTDNRADAPTIIISISTNDPVRLSIPINNPSAGTVAILIDKNGQETVVKTSVSGKDCLYVTVTGSTTIKVADTGKRFNDVNPNEWFSSSVDFVTARKLFQGMDAVTFAPNASMSRAMLVTVLHNLEGKPNLGLYPGYQDTRSTWYEVAASWATFSGYINGYTDGCFHGDENISREQLAVILYRYVGSPTITEVPNTPFFDYYDYETISHYARDAMYWAVNSGILYTSGRNHLAPQQPATRAEVAWAIQRLMEYLAK